MARAARCWGCAPLRGRLPPRDARGSRGGADSILLPAARGSLPPEKELTVLGATHKAPCTPSRPSCPGGRSQLPPKPSHPTNPRSPALKPGGQKKEVALSYPAGFAGASLGHSDGRLSLILTLRVPYQGERAGGFPFHVLSVVCRLRFTFLTFVRRLITGARLEFILSFPSGRHQIYHH